MTTQYTSTLKLALPVQGELSGTWGDVVNDNITSMVEEAIAGRAVINTWTTNSHTLTSANGTTSESRCAMLEFTDTGTALSGDATVICPTAAKIYICKNDAGQKVTIKTSAGTGVAIANGQTMFVFCDGTNVVEAVTSMSSLKLGTAATSVEVTAILDEDTMSSDSPTSLATQQSIKAYVDSQVTAQDLDFGGDSGTGSVDLDSQSLTIAGTTNEIETSAADQTLTIGLPDAVTVTTSVTTPTVQATNVKANDGTAAVTIADSTGQTTIADAVLTTADINAGTIDNTTIGATTASTGAFTTVTSSGNTTVSGSLVTDTIAEETATAGVTVDGLLVKDTGIGVADASGTDVAGSDVTVRGGAGTGTGAGGELLFKVAPAGSTGSSVNALATGMKLDSTKALYIDTINELTSAAGVTIDSVLLKDDVVNATDIETSRISANDGTTAINIADSTGAVDIDTSLNVDGTVQINSANALTLRNDTSADADEPKITFDNDTFAGANHANIRTGNGGLLLNIESPSTSTFQNRHKLVLNGGAADDFQYNLSTDNGSSYVNYFKIDGGNTVFNDGQNAKDFTVKSDGSANMLVVDGTNDRVGILTGSPQTTLQVGSTNPQTNALISGRVNGNAFEWGHGNRTSGYYGVLGTSVNNGTPFIGFSTNANSGTTNTFDTDGFIGSLIRGTTGGALLFEQVPLADQDDQAASERMRITGSAIVVNNDNRDQNFQVKSENHDDVIFVDAANDTVGFFTTNSAPADSASAEGTAVIGNGQLQVSKNGATPMKVNRIGTDGDLVRFHKAGSSGHFGSIGYLGGDFYVGSSAGSGAAFRMDGTNDQIYPSNAAGAARDDALNLGASTVRFKNLYLSNAVVQDGVKQTTTATTEVTLETFAHADHDGAKVVITAATSADTYVTELLIATNGTTAVATEYGQIGTGSALATYDVDISGNDVRIRATPASTTSTTFRVAMTLT